ncbi:class I SAM-dependent methyltransferase [Staphylococcus massiliensis]|uniref:Methyltransferase domain-containing protein n=1 Tax=Staphylococcus massiliensis S46 TaxID=1229783 RepID=K9B5D3_9STAP|nr:methyltransferase domain-containing protein [Staphylococcus massiliensis]EKU50037.1 hypothetical protein C273_02173 [Staphylococcus massiliensis S46]MCG3402256.1 class I SAM-dependent methyltransferase [Staphylococcus massiliensis]MCG3412777.1 class I SAM-dependent methyltransferase [Staphylococcus massiliensis]POA00299.1 class I SAM-dependent methyltransferase [Staphylococcus massiliensis CCUG 55927]
MSNEDVFKNLANKYDVPERVALANIIASELRNHIEADHEQTLIDYGGGTGLVSLQLIDLFKHITIMDASREMIDVATSKIETEDLKNVDSMHIDVTKDTSDASLPKADIIILSLVLLHVTDKVTLLKQLRNMLKEDGAIYIVDFDKNERVTHPKVTNGFTEETLQVLCDKADLKYEGRNVFYKGEKIFVKEDAEVFVARITR